MRSFMIIIHRAEVEYNIIYLWLVLTHVDNKIVNAILSSTMADDNPSENADNE